MAISSGLVPSPLVWSMSAPPSRSAATASLCPARAACRRGVRPPHLPTRAGWPGGGLVDIGEMPCTSPSRMSTSPLRCTSRAASMATATCPGVGRSPSSTGPHGSARGSFSSQSGRNCASTSYSLCCAATSTAARRSTSSITDSDSETSAPNSRSVPMACARFRAAAKMSGVCFHSRSRASRSAPASASSRIASPLPDSAAKWSAVTPLLVVLACTSAPAASSASTTPAPPARLARWREV